MCTWLISVGIDWYRLVSSRGGDVDYGKRSELSLEGNRMSKRWVVIRESESVSVVEGWYISCRGPEPGRQ
jgi:hypothetical protein